MKVRSISTEGIENYKNILTQQEKSSATIEKICPRPEEFPELCRHAGVEKSKVYPHNLRHLFACIYYDTHHDLCHLADMQGHSSVDTTRIYTSKSPEEQQRQINELNLVKPASFEKKHR